MKTNKNLPIEKYCENIVNFFVYVALLFMMVSSVRAEV